MLLMHVAMQIILQVKKKSGFYGKKLYSGDGRIKEKFVVVTFW